MGTDEPTSEATDTTEAAETPEADRSDSEADSDSGFEFGSDLETGMTSGFEFGVGSDTTPESATDIGTGTDEARETVGVDADTGTGERIGTNADADTESEPDSGTDTDADLSALLSSATLMLFVGSLGSLSRLLEQVLIGRVLSASVYGRVNVGIAVLGIASTIAMLGMKSGIPRYMSRFEDDQDVRGAWLTGTLIAIGAATVLAAGLLVNVDWVGAQFEEPVSPALLSLFVLALPFVVGMESVVGGIRGRENTIYRTYVRDLFYNGSRIVVLALLLVAGFGAVGAGYAYVVAAIGALVVGTLLLNRLVPLVGPIRTHAREMITYSLPLMIASTVSILLSQIDTLMLAGLVPSAAVGVYSAAYTLAAGVAVITSSFGFLYFPLTSRLDAGGNRGEIDRMYKVTTKWVYVVSFPAILCFLIFPDDLLLAVFGDYARGGTALAIVASGFFVSAAYGRSQDTLSAFGYTTAILAINVGAATLNIALNAALIPIYGIDGAAIASAVSYASLNGVALGILWYRSGINPFSRRSTKTFLLLPAVLLPATTALSTIFTVTLVTLFPFLVVAGLASIAVLAVTDCLQPEDEIPIELVEDRIGIRVPLIRRYIPEANGDRDD